MAEVKVGDHVLVNKKYKAVVKYIGSTSFKEGIWYGVELEKEKGKHNGTVSAANESITCCGSSVSSPDGALPDAWI